ncbi:DUF1844 domain-containing protein [bacterium]|nr:DUF1844 domain-containing protein [bacterium]
MRDEEKNDGPIKVVDRRRFNTDGSMRDEAPEEIAQKPLPKTPPPAPKAPPPQAAPESQQIPSSRTPDPEPRTPSPKGDYDISFPQFIFSLASSIQMALGLMPNPVTNQVRINLASAKQSIDILAMLEDKTRGNLDEEEAQMLKQVIYELRMVYVEVTNKINEAKK